MVKLVLTGIWVCAITLASVYFSVKLATAPAPPADDSKQSQLELVKGETITVPIIGDGAVTGYFLGRVSFMMNKDTVKGMTLPLTEMTTDELFTLLVGNKMVDISKLKSFDPQAFRDAIKKGMNEKLGGEYVSEVMLEQLDYLSKEDVKANASGQQKKTADPVKIIEPPPPEAASAAH
ncbi:hypothetical protein ACDY96_35160 [Rhizobium mongolense]|jgi:hypothetical protein|uniref:Uncharacterized protein n=3 Tax=Rhizobium TaxID=379 RepID=A0A7W6RMV3_9HYPH|nr:MULTISPECIES: membrane protein [Rhizobium]OWK26632.1 membrane protein [Rhizobium yanglingense]APO66440.1 hypothetical protein IE4872_CH00782 [Rhizobium gallicum]MBB4227675.1 hypothetical protein [Rhizobium mongolense]MBB4274758.1 hypothetical protein [Rhizobium mongolense]TVZ65163.1 hypothetical protein BCL32_5451 [Rhizobium mongolense USDA 1844]